MFLEHPHLYPKKFTAMKTFISQLLSEKTPCPPYLIVSGLILGGYSGGGEGRGAAPDLQSRCLRSSGEGAPAGQGAGAPAGQGTRAPAGQGAGAPGRQGARAG